MSTTYKNMRALIKYARAHKITGAPVTFSLFDALV